MAQQLGLSPQQVEYLLENMELFLQVNDYYISNSSSPEAAQTIQAHIDLMMSDQQYSNLNQTHGYPVLGSEAWTETLNYDAWYKLTLQEKILAVGSPTAALLVRRNVQRATEATIQFTNENGHNNKSDAFRHAYFNFLNCRDLGRNLALAFAIAHESEVPLTLNLEKQMDMFTMVRREIGRAD
jgi:hypothetical protein